MAGRRQKARAVGIVVTGGVEAQEEKPNAQQNYSHFTKAKQKIKRDIMSTAEEIGFCFIGAFALAMILFVVLFLLMDALMNWRTRNHPEDYDFRFENFSHFRLNQKTEEEGRDAGGVEN